MVTNSADVLLRDFVECADPERAEQLLEALIVEHAQPEIRRIVRDKLAFQGAPDPDDIAPEAVVELRARLRTIKSANTEPTANFSGYAVAAADHACNERLRRKCPNRHRLKTRLRYLLGSEKEFALWDAGNSEWVCGLASWRVEGRAPAAPEQVAKWQDLSGVSQHAADLIRMVFERLGGPVGLDDLVGIMAQIWRIADSAPAREMEGGDFDPAERIELKRWLAELWAQVRELPVDQRIALLLHLRTSTDYAAVKLLPPAGVAAIREIAKTLEFPVEEFADVWRRLPLDDSTIAERLGVSRERVMELRRSARESLA